MAVDIAILRGAAAQLDELFDDVSTQLNSIDNAISGAAAAWTSNAAKAFPDFTAYLERSRSRLQAELAGLSNGFVRAANGYETQDRGAADAISSTSRNFSTSTLDL